LDDEDRNFLLKENSQYIENAGTVNQINYITNNIQVFDKHCSADDPATMASQLIDTMVNEKNIEKYITLKANDNDPIAECPKTDETNGNQQTTRESMDPSDSLNKQFDCLIKRLESDWKESQNQVECFAKKDYSLALEDYISLIHSKLEAVFPECLNILFNKSTSI
jgi:hypothetical protein